MSVLISSEREKLAHPIRRLEKREAAGRAIVAFADTALELARQMQLAMT